MRLEKEQLVRFGPEIAGLYKKWLDESPTSGLIYFGAFNRDELMGVGAVRCYMGHWYLRAFVVKPEYRGRGLQKKIMRESLKYLADKTDTAWVSVFPDNLHSIRNIEAVGFKFEKRKKLEDGNAVLVYRKSLSRNS